MHDRGTLPRTTTELGAHEKGAHDKHVRVTGMRARQRRESDRGILLLHRFLCRNKLVYKQNKKDPRKSGASQRL